MKAQMHTNSFGDITLYVKGDLSFENNEILRKKLEKLSQENPHAMITIDMDNVDFVGASGINLFVDSIKFLNQNKERIKLINLKSEFLQVFKLYEFDAMQALFNEFDSDETQNLNTMFGNRSKTFEN